MLSDLRVHELKARLLEPFHSGEPWRVLLKAPTGSGKSTGIAPMLLEQTQGLIIVVQPRRIAARMLAHRVASMCGEAVGKTVGYTVRHDSKRSAQTRILFVTDGVLQRLLIEDCSLRKVECVVFDEFHERRITSDISLAKCVALQQGKRPDLKLCVMSATLDSSLLADYLSPCRLLESEGRSFPVDVNYVPVSIVNKMQKRRVEAIWDRCAKVCRQAIVNEPAGHILIFLPGVYEIRRCVECLEHLKETKDYGIYPLYSSLPAEKQDMAVIGRRGELRVIVATNVAETSLTIDGVSVVIDSGLARIARFDANRGLDSLMIEPISRASAQQRAGRAGRTAAGVCYRLWSEHHHANRPEFETPEVHRVELSEPLLTVAHYQSGVEGQLQSFPWVEPPEETRYRQALELLTDLGALEANHEVLTGLGARLLKFPLHPRFARMLVAGAELDCLSEVLFIAALCQGDSLLSKRGGAVGKNAYIYEDDRSDFEAEYRAFATARQMKFQISRCENAGIMARAAKDVDQALSQLQEVVQARGWPSRDVDFTMRHTEVSEAVLRAFPDHVGVALPSSTTARLVGKRSGQLASDSTVKGSSAFIALGLTEVGGKEVVTYLSRCLEVSFDSLRAVFPDVLHEVKGAQYEETIRRVVLRQELRYRDLTLHSSTKGEPPLDQAAEILAAKVASGELKLKQWDGEVEQWIARLLGLREWMPELELPSFNEEDRALALVQICEGALGYKEIKNRSVMPALQSWLSSGQHASLEAYAPVRLKLTNGQSVKVRYQVGHPPTIALVVQRLYGVRETPTIANGLPVQVNICAPNQRPWQMTADLAGFWERGFEQMKKDLAGRYPKHNWNGPCE